METFAAREAKNAFGRLLDTAQREPVTIEKKGRPVVVVLSKHAYDVKQQQLRELRSLKETDQLLSTEANRERLMPIDLHGRDWPAWLLTSDLHLMLYPPPILERLDALLTRALGQKT